MYRIYNLSLKKCEFEYKISLKDKNPRSYFGKNLRVKLIEILYFVGNLKLVFIVKFLKFHYKFLKFSFLYIF